MNLKGGWGELHLGVYTNDMHKVHNAFFSIEPYNTTKQVTNAIYDKSYCRIQDCLKRSYGTIKTKILVDLKAA